MKHVLLLVAIYLALCCASLAQSVLLNPPSGSSQNVAQSSGSSLNANIFEQVRYADQFSGGDACAKIANAISNLPTSGGTVDARAFQGAQSCSTGVTISKAVRLLLGATAYSWPGPYPLFQIAASGVSIEGIGRQGLTQLIAPNNSAGTTVIYVTQTQIDTAIRHLQIIEPMVTSTQGCLNPSGTTGPSFAIQIDAAAPPANSMFFIEDVYVYGGYSGIQAINPINSTLKDVRVACTKSDGFSFVGNGTTVTCVNCYANRDGGNGFTILGLANVTLVGGEADVSGQDGIYADDYNGVQSVGLTITGLDVEASTNNGIYTNLAQGTSVAGSNILNNTGDGIRVSGGDGFTMTGGRLQQNHGYGVNAGVPSTNSHGGVAGQSATDIAIIATVNASNTSGFLNDPNRQVLSYAGAALGIGGATWSVGSGAPTQTCATGSLYSNVSGGAGSTFYVCQSGVWTPK
jgi:hypothetical protein